MTVKRKRLSVIDSGDAGFEKFGFGGDAVISVDLDAVRLTPSQVIMKIVTADGKWLVCLLSARQTGRNSFPKLEVEAKEFET